MVTKNKMLPKICQCVEPIQHVVSKDQNCTDVLPQFTQLQCSDFCGICNSINYGHVHSEECLRRLSNGEFEGSNMQPLMQFQNPHCPPLVMSFNSSIPHGLGMRGYSAML